MPWLAPLLPVPPDAGWPRLQTVPHPRAVGSLGAQAIEWIETRSALRLHWWQRWTLTRLLEHDQHGDLVWKRVVLSTPRQCGKTVLVRELAVWRLHQRPRFGQRQGVMWVANNLVTAQAATAAWWAWAAARPVTYKVTRANGRPSVALLDQLHDGDEPSMLELRAAQATFGASNVLGIGDEAHDIDPSQIDNALEPTLLLPRSSQLLLVSTAHSRATATMPGRRRDAIAELLTPRRTLLVEWSAALDDDVTDPVTWRAASPAWNEAREETCREQLTRAQAGSVLDPQGKEWSPMTSFESQYLNRWGEPAKSVQEHETGDPMVGERLWAEAARNPAGDRAEGVVVAIESDYGHGAAVAAAWLLDGPDGTPAVVHAGASLFDSLDAATGWFEQYLDADPDAVAVFVGGAAGVAHSEAVADLPITCQPRGVTELAESLVTVRRMLGAGTLFHDGDGDLTAQVLAARVAPNPNGGLRLLGSHRADALRAFCWAVQEATRGMLGDGPMIG